MGNKFSRSAWFIPILLAGIVAAVGWWAQTTVRNTLRQKMGEELKAALHADVTALEIWISNQKRLAHAIAQDPYIEITARKWLTSEDAVPGPVPAESMEEYAEFTRYLSDRLKKVQFEVGQLISTNFIIIADTGRGRMRGSRVMDELVVKYAEVFQTGQPVLITPFNPFKQGFSGRRPSMPRFPEEWRERMRSRLEEGEPQKGQGPPMNNDMSPTDDPSREWERRGGRRTERPPGRAFPNFNFRDFSIMQVAVPIKNGQGQVAGALAVMIQPEAEFSRILSVARIGNSGETFAFDQNGLLLSQSRFEDSLRFAGLIENRSDSKSSLHLTLKDPGLELTDPGFSIDKLSEWPLMDLVSKALSGDGEMGISLDPTRDYRGVPMVGAYHWLSAHGFGVITKIDASEAYRPLTMVRMIFLVLMLVLVMFAIVLLVSSFLNLIWRKRLSQAELKVRELGQYRLEDKIGEGGMGVVYRATHALLRRQTAIKLLLPERSDAESIRRFESEVQTTCRLTHPNTVQVYDYGRTSEGSFYYAMEYLEGTNLRELVREFGPQPDGRVLHVLSQVCASLSEAHSAGLIHRDIKPANIFLCVRGGIPDHVKVLDFGLVKQAKSVDRREAYITSSKSITGTPHYLAPEAIKSPESADQRSDIYAVGAVGYFLLTGAHVFDGENVMEVFQKQLSDEPIPPSQRINIPISRDLESLVLGCLSKNPSLRPQGMDALLQRLKECQPEQSWTQADMQAWWVAFQKNQTSGSAPKKEHSAPVFDKTLIVDRIAGAV